MPTKTKSLEYDKSIFNPDTDCNLYIFLKKQDDTKIEYLPQMTLIITNQFVKFVRFVGNKKLCSSVILSFKNKTKSIINPAKCVYR